MSRGLNSIMQPRISPMMFTIRVNQKIPSPAMNRIRFMAGDGIFWFTLIVNIIGLILGCMMLFSPLLTLSAITTCAGVYLILLGVDAIVLAFSRVGRKF